MSMTPPIEAPAAPAKRNRSVLLVSAVLVAVATMCLMLIAVGFAMLFPLMRQRRLAERRTDAIQRMQRLSTATLVYATDNDDRLPLASNWMDSVYKFDPSGRDFISPMVGQTEFGGGTRYGIAFMAPLSGVEVKSVAHPAEHVMLFDSILMGRNASSGLETVPKPPRFGRTERGGNVIAFVDGHVKLVSALEAVGLK